MNSKQTNAWSIRLENLTVGYDKRAVLSDINAELPAGKISMILGSSGCGKSTLLRHIVGLRKPMSGNIYLGKYNIQTLPVKTFRSLRRRMGMLFQDGALLGSLTLLENVSLPLCEHTKLDQNLINSLVTHTLNMVGLGEYVNYYPNELSGGMRKRAGLARAMVTSPPILLCDEPTSGLDPINSAQMDQLLLSLKEDNPDMTIIVVSHDIQSLNTIADHVLMLNNGKIAFNGPVEGLHASNDPYIKDFLSRKQVISNRDLVGDLALTPEQQIKLQAALDAWIDK